MPSSNRHLLKWGLASLLLAATCFGLHRVLSHFGPPPLASSRTLAVSRQVFVPASTSPVEPGWGTPIVDPSLFARGEIDDCIIVSICITQMADSNAELNPFQNIHVVAAAEYSDRTGDRLDRDPVAIANPSQRDRAITQTVAVYPKLQKFPPLWFQSLTSTRRQLMPFGVCVFSLKWMWLILPGVSVVLTLTAGIREFIRRRRPLPTACLYCRYDLAGLPPTSPCPECGIYSPK